MPDQAVTISPVNSSAHGKPPEPRSGAFSGIMRHCLWGLTSIIAVLVSLEFLFAWAHIGEEEFAQVVPVLGFNHIPNKFVTFRAEGFSQSRTNSEGFRDLEWTLAKPIGTHRIAVLGNSMAEAYQVDPNESFAKLLERNLNKKGKERWQVMNFGMSGFSTVQELYCFKEKALKYKPDICILAFHIGDNEKNIYMPGAEEYLPRPYCKLDEQGRLLTDWSCLEEWKNSNRFRFYSITETLRKSRIWAVCTKLCLEVASNKWYQKLSKPIAALFNQDGLEKAPAAQVTTMTETDMLGTKKPAPAISLAKYVPSLNPAPTDPRALGARISLINNAKRFEVTGAIIDELNRVCKASGCKLLVAALPAPNNSLFYFKQLKMMEALSRESGFGFVNIGRVFPSLAPLQESDYFHTVHFTYKGHKLVAEDLERALVEQQFIRPWNSGIKEGLRISKLKFAALKFEHQSRQP